MPARWPRCDGSDSTLEGVGRHLLATFLSATRRRRHQWTSLERGRLGQQRTTWRWSASEGPFPPHAPLIVGSPEIRDLFSRERSISPALRAAASCDLALLGIGTLGEEASLVRYGHHDRDCSELLPLDGYRALVETLERDSAVGSKEAAAEIADRAVDCEALGRVPIVVEQPRAVAKSVHSRRFNVLSKAARLVTLWRPDREPRSSPARTVRRRTR